MVCNYNNGSWWLMTSTSHQYPLFASWQYVCFFFWGWWILETEGPSGIPTTPQDTQTATDQPVEQSKLRHVVENGVVDFIECKTYQDLKRDWSTAPWFCLCIGSTHTWKIDHPLFVFGACCFFGNNARSAFRCCGFLQHRQKDTPNMIAKQNLLK